MNWIKPLGACVAVLAVGLTGVACQRDGSGGDPMLETWDAEPEDASDSSADGYSPDLDEVESDQPDSLIEHDFELVVRLISAGVIFDSGSCMTIPLTLFDPFNEESMILHIRDQDGNIVAATDAGAPADLEIQLREDGLLDGDLGHPFCHREAVVTVPRGVGPYVVEMGEWADETDEPPIATGADLVHIVIDPEADES